MTTIVVAQMHPVTNACVQCYEDHNVRVVNAEDPACVQCTSDLDCGEKGTCNHHTCEGECSTTKHAMTATSAPSTPARRLPQLRARGGRGPCDDGDKCTLEDQCLQGTCLPGNDNPECSEDIVCRFVWEKTPTATDALIRASAPMRSCLRNVPKV